MSDHIDPLGIIWLLGHAVVYLVIIPDLLRRCGWGKRRSAHRTSKVSGELNKTD